ncbi:alpha/beta hydrolase [Streptomyces sp. MST-110588]|uniref:alpha/beta hydrolase n=1 Tax=Streptomyces sp. MST-110588 TaxID=2833628 RepID=UPI001F5DCCF0|nr:alpha/beta hydrolase [Streptomyces sp. MST-110588]UNO41437.1 alpha/beta fold hydrolase [Streptomyces sp. MST-110588]
MTDFVLVPGGYAGGWIWREVAGHLRAAGHQAHPVTPTGLGDRRHLAGPDTGLDTHTEDVVQVLDHIAPQGETTAPHVVVVGHSYGILPALGAVGRRTGRVARLVYLDTALPRDGLSVLDALPDPAARERLLRRAEESPDGRSVPPPPLEDEKLWGSLAGIPRAGLERLARLAAPMPLGALTQPFHRTAPRETEPPSTGILCTASGFSTAMVRELVASGDPWFQPLADPRVGFFDLETGHYPMLSCPAELAGLLVRAAAGEGERL